MDFKKQTIREDIVVNILNNISINNDELVDESIIEVKKKKSIKKLSKEDNDELVDEPIIEVKKKKSIVKKS